ncbi:hypothetical protein V2J09_000115 [Rumex salicifolius]
MEHCEIATDDWSSKAGSLARSSKGLEIYVDSFEVCVRNQIGVQMIWFGLLISGLIRGCKTVELFILRLSRNRAGIAFTSRLYPALPLSYERLFKKSNPAAICKEGNQEWVEDPTNSSQLYAHNRIRKTLYNETSFLIMGIPDSASLTVDGCYEERESN